MLSIVPLCVAKIIFNLGAALNNPDVNVELGLSSTMYGKSDKLSLRLLSIVTVQIDSQTNTFKLLSVHDK